MFGVISPHRVKISGSGSVVLSLFFFFQAEDGIRDLTVTGVQTCALPIYMRAIADGCPACEEVGATVATAVHARSGDKELQDVNFYGHTANMSDIDTRSDRKSVV